MPSPPVTTATVSPSHHFSDAGMVLRALALLKGQFIPRKAKQAALLDGLTFPGLCNRADAAEIAAGCLHVNAVWKGENNPMMGS